MSFAFKEYFETLSEKDIISMDIIRLNLVYYEKCLSDLFVSIEEKE